MPLIFSIFLQSQPTSVFSIGDWIAIIGLILTIITGLLVFAFRSGYLVSTLKTIEDDLKSIKHDVKFLPPLIERVNILWRAKVSKNNSPIVLNEYGKELLASSKIDGLTDQYYEEIIEKVKSLKPENAYQVQEGLIDVVASYKGLEKCKLALEQAAFVSGSDIDTLLLVAALNIRDKVVTDLNLSISDIDRFDPKKNQLESKKD